MTALLVILILVVLIVVHELGHFIVAKIIGVRVQEFGVGYPPRAFRFGKIGDTEYTLNWIPFGGFVRLFGDEGESERGRGSFVEASRVKQAAILFAGILMNLVLAWILFAAALHMGIPRPVGYLGPGVQMLISDVVPGSPADAARIHPGDELIGMVDEKGSMPADLLPKTVAEYVGMRAGERIQVEYIRDGITVITGITPANAVIPGLAGRAGLGIGLVLVSSEPLPWSQAIGDALSEMLLAFVRVAQSVWGILANTVQGTLSLSGVIGPVGLVSVVGAAAKTGFAQVLALAAFISVNLAVINLIPIPALDGGRLAIVAVESVLRRPAPKLAIYILNAVGIAAIAFLMIAVTYHDIARLVA